MIRVKKRNAAIRVPKEPYLLGSVFGRTDISRIFIFGLLLLVGKSVQKNPPGKSPANFIQQKSSATFLQRGQGALSIWTREMDGIAAKLFAMRNPQRSATGYGETCH